MMRPFICTPSSWNTCPILNGVSEDAELLFRRVAQCTDGKWQFPVQVGAMEHSIRTAAFAEKRRFRAWAEFRIRQALHELMAVGLLIRCEVPGRAWLEVGALWRYEKGEYEKAEKGESKKRQKKTSDQEELPLAGAGELSVVPAVVPAVITKKKAGGSDVDPDRFARDEGDSTDPLWCDLLRAVGLVESHKNGALWLKRLKLSRGALRVALSDYLSKAPEERSAMNAAAYITAAFEAETRRAAAGAERKVG